MKVLIISCLFLFNVVLSFSQGEANNWYFGYNTGINFSSGVPVLLNDGAMSTDEGCATISDASGNLLFYTDGVNVYNKNHQLMPNGTGLLGSPSSTQSGVIIKRPGSSSIYYIFTTPAPENGYVNGLRYSEVDLSLDGGNGAVTVNKNILLQTPTCEKITGVLHQNNQDIWVISHDTGSNQFRTFLVTSAGVNLTPTFSSVGEIVIEDPAAYHVVGQLKAYLGGKKIAAANYTSDNFELFDFDNATGILSNPILLDDSPGGAYGVEFSPDGTKLYGSIIAGTPIGQPLTENLFQWDLCAGTQSAIDIINSKQLIFSGSGSDQGIGALQLAPDGKIYAARYNGLPPGDPNNTHYLGVINDPNASGVACNYVDDGFFLGALTSGVGLPNFVPYNLDIAPPPTLTFSYDSILCLNNGTADPIFHSQFAAGGQFSCNDVNLAIDPNTGQIDLNISSIGVFNIQYELIISSCGIQSYDTTVQVRIEDMNQVADFSVNSPICENESTISAIKDPLSCSNGQFSSSAGLIIDSETGEIDISASLVGNYVITYTCPAILCKPISMTTQNFEIIAASISPVISCTGSTSSVTFNWDVLVGATDYTISFSINGGVSQNGGNQIDLSYTVNGLTENDVVDVAVTANGSECYSVGSGSCTAICISPTISIQPINDSQCEGNPVTLSVSETGGNSYLWQVSNDGGTTFTSVIDVPGFVSGATSTTLNINDNSGLDGTIYQLTINDVNNACPITSDMANLTVNPFPVINATNNGPLCEGESLDISVNNVQGALFSWTGPGYFSGLQNNTLPLVMVTNSGDYTVTATVNGCTSTSNTTVIINSPTIVNINPTGPFCENDGVTVLSVDIVGGIWSGKGIIDPNLGIFDPFQALIGLNDITYTLTTGCGGSDMETIVVNAKPIADFSVENNVLDPISPVVTIFDNSSNVNLYEWTFGDGGTSNEPEPTHIYSEEVRGYAITLTTTSVEGCRDTAIIVVNVPETLIYYVPNSFTPNGDERNNVFLPIFTSGFDPQEYLLQIYDRWGERIFESMDSKVGWDGTYGSKIVQDGTYTWKITFGLTINAEKQLIVGHVVLFK